MHTDPSGRPHRKYQVPRWMKDQIFLEQAGHCHWCDRLCSVSDGREIPDAEQPDDLFTIDHLVPYVMGGRPEISNLVGSCKACNRLKGKQEAGLFKKRMDRIRAMTREQLIEDVVRVEYDKDQAYRERSRLVAFLSRLYPSHLGVHVGDDPERGEDWRRIVFIQTPAGQLSWHIHDGEIAMFKHLSDKGRSWDGHTTREKYARLRELPGEGARFFANRQELDAWFKRTVEDWTRARIEELKAQNTPGVAENAKTGHDGAVGTEGPDAAPVAPE